jgi:uncharacterized protein
MTQPINPLSIAFDIDGVVADTMRLFLDITRHDYGIDDLNYEDLTSYELSECLDMPAEILKEALAKLIDGNYAYPLKPIIGAREVLTRLGKLQGGLLFVTARPHVGPIAAWMEELLPLSADTIDIVPTGGFDEKVQVLLDRGINFFVEDRLETCYVLKSAGITPILFKQPWNRREHPFTEVEGWSDLDILINHSEGQGKG